MTAHTTHHPSDDPIRLRAYLTDNLSSEERGDVEEHLADCDLCRSRLVELHVERDELEQSFAPPEPLLRQLGDLGGDAPSTRRPMAGQLRLLAAVLATLVLGGGFWIFQSRQPPGAVPRSEVSGPVFRTTEAVETLELLSPAPETTLPAGPVDLSWTPVVGAVRYRVMVLDPAGVPIAEQRTEQTLWRWPGGVDAGFWYVEAELADGSRIESEPSQLVFEPARPEP